MSITHWRLPAAMDKKDAQSQYVEQFGDVIVTSNHLKMVVLALSLAVLALVWLNIRTYLAFRYVKPLIIRINEVGRAEAVPYDSFEYRPQESEIKYFLIDFVQRH